MKKKIAGVIGLLCVIGCVLMLITQFRSYEYAEEYVHISEPYGSGFVYQGMVNKLIVNNHTYEFESAISEEERSEFVKEQEKLCKLLEKNNLSTKGLTFRILENYSNRTESENGFVYYGIDTMKTWEQILTTIQVCKGDYTNYGYLYALSNQVAEELKWTCDDVTVKNAKVFEEDSSLLNLVYPCFAEKYSDNDIIHSCKALARELLTTTEDIWSEEKFLSQRTIYAQNETIEFEPTYILFAYNGESCPLKLSCKYLEVFWDSSFVACTQYLQGYIPKDYVGDVNGFIHTFERLDEHLSIQCEKWGVEPKEKVPTQMMERLPRNAHNIKTGGLYYYRPENYIYATTVTCLAHEYVHHLYWLLCGCSDPAYEQWNNEAVAYYYALDDRYEFRVNVINHVDPSYRDRLEAQIGEAFDSPSDHIKYMRIGWRNIEIDYMDGLKDSFDLCCTFGEYFVRIYGDDKFLQSMMYPSRVEEFTGLSMDEILDNWVVDMGNPEND